MRKPTLLALTTLTALGATAVAGTAVAGSPGAATLASTKKTIKTDLLSNLAGTRSSVPSSLLDSVWGGPDLVAFHDIHAVDRRNLSERTGLPMVRHPRRARPKPRPVVVSAPAAAVTATPAPVAPVPAPATAAPTGGVWYQLRMCESGDNYATNTGNGYYGAYQFDLQTWYGLGFSGLPSNASPAVQDEAAQELQARSGWSPWPQCAAKLGLY